MRSLSSNLYGLIMLKITKKQTVEYLFLARNLLGAVNEGLSRASMDLLIKQSFVRKAPDKESIYCHKRKVHFYLDRRLALLEWLETEYRQIDRLYPGMKHSNLKEHSMAYSVGVMQWGDKYLYSHLPFQDAEKVYRLEDALGDLSWYHTSKIVPYSNEDGIELFPALQS